MTDLILIYIRLTFHNKNSTFHKKLTQFSTFLTNILNTILTYVTIEFCKINWYGVILNKIFPIYFVVNLNNSANINIHEQNLESAFNVKVARTLFYIPR